MALLIVGLVLLFWVIVLLPMAIRIVPEYQRLIVLRLGRVLRAKGPGLVFLIPIVDRGQRVDLREFFFEVPHQTSITKDNAAISIDFLIFFKVLDPMMSVIQVQDFSGAAGGLATTTLRSVVGDLMLDEVLARRDHINQVMQVKLDEVTERWGVKVTQVEIREIVPPPQVQEAMTRQMSAERTRRAVVTESEGTREAAVNVAEGQKRSAILHAEGDRQSTILRAEGDRQAAILQAEGYALALKAISEIARGLDDKTMGLQYLQALRDLGSMDSTKFVLPLELTSLLRGIGGYVGGAFAGPEGHSTKGTVES
jgi:regulator of protease activity HflC (stomatin/prohibitin superfamily)